MAWTYKFDEIDKEVTKDTSTPNRFTFNRYLYFEPDQYDDWSKRKSYEGRPFTAELVGNPNIPAIGDHLSGSLSAFYVTDVSSISNLIEEEHSDHCSYAVVTVEYENTPALGSISEDIINVWGKGKSDPQPQPQPTSGTITRFLEPWNEYVADFSVINQEIEVPWTKGYLLGTGNKIPITNTAGQPIYGMTTSEWIQKISWTVNTREETNYSLSAAIINDTDISLANGKVVIPYGEGLLLPPSFKKLYFTNDQYTNEPYYQWSFEIIRNPNGFMTEILNAGTKMRPGATSTLRPAPVDICTWYVYNPSSQVVPAKEFGTFNEMMAAKNEVYEYNKTVQSETAKRVWSGDFVQSPVPLDEYGNIDEIAVTNPNVTYSLFFYKYKYGTWNILYR